MSGLLRLTACACVLAASAGPLPAAAEAPRLPMASREADARRALYAAKGFQIGGIRLDAALSHSAIWDDNPAAMTDARPENGTERAGLWSNRTTLSVRAMEGPARWRYGLSAEASAVTAPEDDSFTYKTGGVEASVSGHSWNRSSLRLAAGWRRAVETPGDPDHIGAAAEPVRKDVYAAQGRARLRFGRWLLGGGLEGRWIDYHDSRLRDGRTLDEEDRDRVEVANSARLGCAVAKTVDVFVENANVWSAPTRAGPLGFAYGYAVAQTRAGVAMDFSERLIGEGSAGVLRTMWADGRAPLISEPAFLIRFAFAATPLITLSGGAKRMVEDYGELGYSGVLVDRFSLKVEHELLRNLILSAEGGYERRRWIGRAMDRHSARHRLAGSAEWRLNGRWYLRAGGQYEQRHASLSAFDFERARIALTVGARL